MMAKPPSHKDDATNHHHHQHRCHFPVSRAEPSKGHTPIWYTRVPIYSDDESQDKERRSCIAENQGQILFAAWAVLLHRYVGSEVVSFAAFCSPDPPDERNAKDTLASKDERPGAGNGSERCNGTILHYRVLEDIRLRDVCKISREPSTASDLSRGGPVNTAIDFSSQLGSARRGQQDEEEEEEKLPIVQMGTRHWGINASFDLILETDTSYSPLSIYYRTSTVRPGYAASISRSLQTILDSLTSDTYATVAQLEVPDDEQKLQMLSWNPPNPFTAKINACMHDLVSAKCVQMPTSEAVCSWEGSLTYSGLDRLARIAAERLQSSGVEPGVYVPFAYEKTIWAVVAMLAILKAGGAFVPLNPQDPKVRLEQIIQSVGARVIVTSREFMGLFDDIVDNVVVISKETVELRVPDHSFGHDENLKTAVRSACPDDPIFVLFTSGSTGTAKGMIHTHTSICTHTLSHGSAMGYHGARVLQFAAYTFDVAIIDTFTTLLFGGCICIPSEEDRRNGIVDVIRSLRADYAILTPSFAGVIDPAEVPTLKILAVGGEALPQERIQRFAEKVRLIQIYGPAEVGICITMEMQSGTRPETVGNPLNNSSCWLVDPNDSDRLVPIGTVGELVVAGPSLAQGYLNDAERTARSFIAAPAWAQELDLHCSRFYRTGDLLRYNLDAFDGTMDFVGRKDAQIKLRGQRIEPGEIEYHIGHLPGVTVCMATRPESGCYAGELIAVVQLHDESDRSTRVRNEPLCLTPVQSLRIQVIREHLEKVLPGYMIPSSCLVVQCMPFVPSLKVDRRRVEKWLADMETRYKENPKSQLAPLDRSEETALSLSMKITEYIAIKDKKHCARLQGHDFRLQDVGLDSIQIISLSLFLRRKYAVRVPMKVLLSSKLTVRDLSRLVDAPSLPWVNGQTARTSHELGQLNIRKEAALLSKELIDEIRLQSQNTSRGCPEPHHPISNVLVTGATGYLGAAILHQLLAVPTIHVYALVRCSNTVSGLQKLQDAMISQGRWQESYATRLHAWKGDISRASLGLEEQDVRQVLGRGVSPNHAIHALIHSGARVHYSSDYDSLKSINVDATLSALQLVAQASHLQAFVFVSGGVSPSHGCSSDASSSVSSSDDAQLLDATGYTQTKLVAETMVELCVHSNIFGPTKRTRIVKPGYIIGSTSNGLANRRDFIWRLIAGCVEIGAYNGDDVAKWLYVADVETVARDVCAGVMLDGDGNEGAAEQKKGGAESDGRGEGRRHAIVRVTNGLRLSSIWHILNSHYGYQLVPLPQQDWLSRLLRRIFHVGETHLLFPLLHILERDSGSIGEEASGLMGESATVEEAVTKNIAYLIQVGFLPRPGGSGGVGV